ncbi:hypothetical protein L1987_61960 [Smallanthus sonchifolius]|uniref:Uncharacterized protein n=1 Tax=Smallanthus sonchifolius TaxID=185202 RepID=A0ACB9C968_9ASTR|nr:hypothetical protein L1987_61960 [Smallanthus sonchifolius]
MLFSGDHLLIIGKTRKVWRLRKPNVVQDMFHLVKAEIARAIIPKEFRLVEAFGWAARVYVNSDNACRHGRKTDPLKWMALGPKIKMSLPSFSGHTEDKPQLLKVKPTTPARVLGSLDRIDASESQNLELNESLKKREMSISVMLSKPILALEFNCLKMEVQPPVIFGDTLWRWQHYVVQDMFHLVKSEIARAIIPKEFKLVEAFGWAARVYVNSDNAGSHGRKEFGLPSQVANFSKASSQMTQLLKYSCQIECRVRPTLPASVIGPLDRYVDSESQNQELKESLKKREMGIAVMLSKPIFALEFNCLTMEVHPPVVVSKGAHHPLEHAL